MQLAGGDAAPHAGQQDAVAPVDVVERATGFRAAPVPHDDLGQRGTGRAEQALLLEGGEFHAVGDLGLRAHAHVHGDDGDRAVGAGLGSEELPSQLADADQDKELTKGTLLCTVTDEKNLAMLKIKDVVVQTDASGVKARDYVTELTLWKTA
ncbi:hypothetical protein [Streptomyces sp. NPDC050548]|uniref:hypothetical protein n=1 Tax=Streptomyces sp. NPDC050548 TaxID=3365629 RepID=UPI0037B83F4B